jgi:hypothetical protein
VAFEAFATTWVHEVDELQFPAFCSILKPVLLVELSFHPRVIWVDDLVLAVRFEGALIAAAATMPSLP